MGGTIVEHGGVTGAAGVAGRGRNPSAIAPVQVRSLGDRIAALPPQHKFLIRHVVALLEAAQHDWPLQLQVLGEIAWGVQAARAALNHAASRAGRR